MTNEIPILIKDIKDLRSKLLKVAVMGDRKEIRDIKAMLKEKLQIYELIKQSGEIVQEYTEGRIK